LKKKILKRKTTFLYESAFQYGNPKLRNEIIERQRFYTELNDVQAERLFVENVMKLGNQFFF
jgi:hypothetical protein